MKIACPSCEAKYSIGDEKVQNRLAKIRCRKCGADIVIDGRVEPPSISLAGVEGNAGAVASAGGAPQPEFTVDFAENDQRTLALSDVVAAYNAGQVTAETFVWSEGMSDWTPLGQVPAIVDALNVAASQPSHPEPASVRTVSSPPQPATTAARATMKGGASHDLFGRLANAGSEEDVATSQGGGYDPHPAAQTTGARNESSVLFSLSALTASTKSKPAFVPSASASVSSALDDSGLIDLKALASQASATEAAAAASPLGAPLGAPLGVAPPLGMAPLGGLGAPLGGAPFGAPFGGGASPFSAADLAMPRQKSKTGLFIGGGIALAAIIVAAAIALRPEPPPPPAPEQLPMPKVTHTAEPTPPPSSEAKPPATGTAEETTTAKKAPPVVKGGGGGRKKPTGGKSEGSGESTTTPTHTTPTKPSGGSGCAAGDLICEMKKAAGKK